MTPGSWPSRTLDFGRRFLHEWRTDRVPDLAAEVAFWAILSLFPALVALASVLGALDSVVGADVATRVEDNVIEGLQSILTSEASGTIDAVESLFLESRPGLLTFSALLAVWTLSRAFAALVRALDVVYDLDEHRSWAHTRTTAFVLGVGSVIAAAVMLTLVVIGPLFGTGDDVAEAIGLADQFASAWDLLRLPVAFVVLIAWAATVFHIAPDHRTPWRSDLPGALVTTLLWLVFSAGLRIYVSFAQTTNAVFGTLGGVLIVLLWFWLLSLAVLIGGEVNELVLRSPAVERGADRTHELPRVDGGPAVEEDAHDGRGDHHAVGGG